MLVLPMDVDIYSRSLLIQGESASRSMFDGSRHNYHSKHRELFVASEVLVHGCCNLLNLKSVKTNPLSLEERTGVYHGNEAREECSVLLNDWRTCIRTSLGVQIDSKLFPSVLRNEHTDTR